MKLAADPCSAPQRRHAFSLVELMMAMGIGLVLGGTVLLLLFQASKEQRNGLVNATVEMKAHLLQANITACLRSASANQGITPDDSTTVYDAYGNKLGYRSIIVFNATNGTYIAGSIRYTAASGQVIYTPNLLSPSTKFLWMTNGPTTRLTNLWFSPSLNLDNSKNSSLVNVCFIMDDNGYAQKNPTNNPASLWRNFSVQMRND